MFSLSSKAGPSFLGFYLLAFAGGLAADPVPASAETGIVNASGVGTDTSEAIGNLLKVTVSKYFRDQPAALVRSVLTSEILPNASSFVQSYKVAEGARPGMAALNASVDLDVIHGLLMLTPKNLGEIEGARALVLVHGAKIPDSITSSIKPGTKVADPYGSLQGVAKERFARRQFGEASVSAADLQALAEGEDISSPELLRGLGAKAGARVAMGLSSRYEAFENENAHNKEERLVLSAVLLDVKTGAVLGRSSVHVVNPKSRREQYVADLQRNLLEESKDLFQDILVAAGRKLVKPEGRTDFALVRVQFPANATLVARFRSLLEAVPGVKTVVEYSIRRGAYDFAVRPALQEAALLKAVNGMQQAPDIAVAVEDSAAAEGEPKPGLTVKLMPKEAAPAPDASGKVPDAAY